MNDSTAPKIIVAMPAYNEEKYIGSMALQARQYADEVIVVDDGSIDRTSKIARLAGAPMDKAAGIDLLKKLGDPVTLGEPLYTIHAEFRADYNFALNLSRKDSGYTIGSPEELPATYVEF